MSTFDPIPMLQMLHPRSRALVSRIAGTENMSKWEPLHLRLAADEFEQGVGMRHPYPRHAKTLRRIAASMYVKRMNLGGAS